MSRKLSFAPGEYYHLYNRGFDKRQTFLDRRDYLRFLASLYMGNSKTAYHPSDWGGRRIEKVFDSLNINSKDRLVDIGAYCLMPNHFHLLVRERKLEGISKVMHKLQTGYSMYFNKKNQRTGGLFEGTFKARHVEDDNYLHYLFAYIHLNPIKIHNPVDWENKIIKNKDKAKSFLASYDYSSFHHYVGDPRAHNKILSDDAFPEYFEEKKDFEHFLDQWINFSDDE